MSEEKLEKLVEKVEELLVVLGKISEDLRAVVSSMKSTMGSQTAQPAPQPAIAVAPPVSAHERRKA